MPYSGIDDLPTSVRLAIPEKDKQERFVTVFNNCMKSGDGEGNEKRCYRVAYASAKNLGKRVKKEVPILNPLASVAFVVSEPNDLEKAREEYLIGPDGKLFQEQYLNRLGLTKNDVMIVDVSQIKWLDYMQPATVIALGKNAKRALGSRADYTLPHPNALRRFGDRGEVARKSKAIRRGLAVNPAINDEFEWCHDTEWVNPNGAFVKTGDSFILTGTNGIKAVIKTAEALSNLENDMGIYEIGLASKELIELRLDGGLCKGRYLLRLEGIGEDCIWKIEKPDAQSYFADRNDAEVLKDKLIKKLEAGDNSCLYWGKPGESVKLGIAKTSNSRFVSIIKTDDEKRIVYGIVLDPYQVDAHDDWISPKEIEETAHGWMTKSRTIGFNHEEEAEGAEVVESWLVPYPSSDDYKKAMANEDHKAYTMPYGDDEVHSGSWVLGTKLSEGDWQMVKDGTLNAYSIGGYGKREPTSFAEMPKVEFIKLSGGGE